MARQKVIQILVNCDVCGFDAKGQSKCADIKAGKPLVEVYKVTPPSEEARPVLGEDGKPLMQEDGKTPQVQLISHPLKVARLDVCSAKAAPYTAAQEAYKAIDGEDVTPRGSSSSSTASAGGNGGLGQTAPNYKTRALKAWCEQYNEKAPKAWHQGSKALLAKFYGTPGYAGWEKWEKGQPPIAGFGEDGKPTAQMTLPAA